MNPEVDLVRGTGAQMLGLEDASAQLILTGPPYFPDQLEATMRAGVGPGADIEALQLAIQTYAWSLRPVFNECFRVLMPGGRMIVQTRDVRLRQTLVPIEGTHRQMIEATGMSLYTRHLWRPSHASMARLRATAALSGHLGPAPLDPEVFLVFWKPGPVRLGEPTHQDVELLKRDIVCTSRGRLPSSHRFQSPIPMLKALVRAHSRPGDLVVDPFAGGGSILVVAQGLGRRAWGCDVDEDALNLARRNVEADAT